MAVNKLRSSNFRRGTMKKYLVVGYLLLAADVCHPQGLGAMFACAKLPEAQQQECSQRMVTYMFSPLPHLKRGTPQQEQVFNVIFDGLTEESNRQAPKQWIPLMLVRADGTVSIAIYYLDLHAAYMPFP
jgi:hypothetical protein